MGEVSVLLHRVILSAQPLLRAQQRPSPVITTYGPSQAFFLLVFDSLLYREGEINKRCHYNTVGGLWWLYPSSYLPSHSSMDIYVFFPHWNGCIFPGQEQKIFTRRIFCIFSHGLSAIRCLDLIPAKQTEIHGEEYCQVKDLKFSYLSWFNNHSIVDASTSFCFFPFPLL